MDVTRIPKIELHLHLDGAVPPETMWRMAQEKHVSLPVDTLDEFYAWLVKTADCRDVNTYLARFELPLQLMQDAPGITRITCDVLTTLAPAGTYLRRAPVCAAAAYACRTAAAGRHRGRAGWAGAGAARLPGLSLRHSAVLYVHRPGDGQHGGKP